MMMNDEKGYAIESWHMLGDSSNDDCCDVEGDGDGDGGCDCFCDVHCDVDGDCDGDCDCCVDCDSGSDVDCGGWCQGDIVRDGDGDEDSSTCDLMRLQIRKFVLFFLIIAIYFILFYFC